MPFLRRRNTLARGVGARSGIMMATMIRTLASIAGTSTGSSERDPLRTAIMADEVWDTDLRVIAFAQRRRAGSVPLDDRRLGDAAIAVAAP